MSSPGLADCGSTELIIGQPGACPAVGEANRTSRSAIQIADILIWIPSIYIVAPTPPGATQLINGRRQSKGSLADGGSGRGFQDLAASFAADKSPAFRGMT